MTYCALWFNFLKGIAAELLSKSVLNELEAATYLVSEIAKPAHIVLVISALAKFMGQCIVLVVEKKCRMFRKYHPKVILREKFFKAVLALSDL